MNTRYFLMLGGLAGLALAACSTTSSTGGTGGTAATTSSSSSTSTSTSSTSGGGATASSSSSGAGGAAACSAKCGDILTGGSPELCATASTASKDALTALGTCICKPDVCNKGAGGAGGAGAGGGGTNDCALLCAGKTETNAACGTCEMAAVTGACSTEASACAAAN